MDPITLGSLGDLRPPCHARLVVPPRLPLGISEFRRIRQEGLAYVDKTPFLIDLIDEPSPVVLLPRPRRFGKTLGLSLLRTYLERSPEDRWPLFEGLAIAAASPAYRQHFQRYPTIALTFKDVKARQWSDCRDAMALILAEVYGEHRYLLEGDALTPEDRAIFAAIAESRANNAQLWASLRNLSTWLARHHGEQVLILIDEYDTPIHAGYVAGYYDEAVEFFRNFLSGALKDNASLWKGVLTGILRVAKDSVFTGLNNLEVYTLLRPEYATHFGFTEPEVQALARGRGGPELLETMREWYNGYDFGGHVIYNPWSVLAFLKSADKAPRPHWAETSSNDLVQEILVRRGLAFTSEMEALIRGEAIETTISEQVALRDLSDRSDLFSLLLFTGYLKVTSERREDRKLYAQLQIPNLEVLTIYEELLLSWAHQGLGGEHKGQELLRALLAGDTETATHLLQDWIESSVSFFDTARPPERFFHGFVLGLLVSLGSRYDVRSNRESGYGRCDVMVSPKTPGQPGVVLELKVPDTRRGESVDDALTRGLEQLEARRYARELLDRGAHPVHELVVVFEGKRVHLRSRGGE